MRRFVYLLVILVMTVLGCQSAPTILKTEVGGVDEQNYILVDTRSALDYSSFHVSGSVNVNPQQFLILSNPVKKIRQLDPDLEQIIERLARKGISPLKTVKLITDQANAIEAKKIKWLLRKLDVTKVEFVQFQDFINKNKPLRPRPEPENAEVWKIGAGANILKQSEHCFVNWSTEKCE